MPKKRALITGVGGQDGSYLAELLLEKEYEVFGLVRRTSKPPVVVDGVKVIIGDMTDQGSLNRAVLESVPDEVYNLAAQSFVGASWSLPVATADITGLGALRLLESLRTLNPKARFYQASSSEMFGNPNMSAYPRGIPEACPLRPRSPYGFSKVFAHNAAVNYRESYGMHISCGIMFNHESPRRGEEFVSSKIIQQLREVKDHKRDRLYLGNLEPRRDFGYAKEYVEVMWQMLQQDEPDDYVIGTGVSHSVKNFVDEAMRVMGVECPIEQDPKFYRPAEIVNLRANYSKAKEKLGWSPKTSFQELVKLMVEA